MLTTPTRQHLPEQRVIFHHLTWDRYQQILQALSEHRSSRLIFDRGTLEITMPLEEHEFLVRMIDLLVRILATTWIGRIKTMGSTTLDYPNLDRGAEPDNAYYLQNQPKVKGRTVDLTQDPPPDLVVEVDITHSDINKLALYAAMGIPEFWQFNGEELQIYQLTSQGYQEVEISPSFPGFPKSKLYQFLTEAREDEIQAERTLRNWILENKT
ncbi:Uma2 family endonuclease [Thermostichus vulcanus]|uniref:Uma2 family endonuclease n=1 Tax=Thermostichus vulcanus str. 'Rupite' TaxID=2813851 RepID=A0ABT0CF73_THEVL|nr:Uma2 family endonuclease [Thermostichus vulcanus]MCJ2544434.1 Uma2 family endonuclease [Thermostichus vulcanus str. 'Rupite']